MRIDYLEYLLEVDKCQSISRAAQKLYIGQTTLSSLVRDMEKEMGFPIFKRIHSGVETTEKGREFLKLADSICMKYRQINLLGKEQEYDRRTVMVLINPSISGAMVFPLNRMIMEHEPYGILNFREYNGLDIGTKIIQGEASIGLTFMSGKEQRRYKSSAIKYNIKVRDMYSDQLYLLVRKDHPLAQEKSVSLEILKHEKLALLPHFLINCDIRMQTDWLQYFHHYTIFTNLYLVKRAVSEQNMISVLSGFSVMYDESFRSDGFQMVPINDLKHKNDLHLCMIHHCYKEMHPLEKKAYHLVPPDRGNFAGV